MASISNDGGGYRRLLFTLGGKRKGVRLGRVPAKVAESVRMRVEAVVSARVAGTSLDPETAAWLGRIDDSLATKLAAVGLISPRASASLAAFTADYIDRRDVKEITRVHLRLARARLLACLGDRPVAHVSPGDADRFLSWLIKNYARATAGRTIGRARQFFRGAVRAKLIADNPFEDIVAPSQANPSRQFFVDRARVECLLAACPDDHWRRIVALARYGGLRCPSEVALLTWADVKADRFWVTSPKTARHEGKAGRWVPLFPELRPWLLRIICAAPAHMRGDPAHMRTEYAPVVPGLESATNLRTGLLRILRRADLAPWPRLFQNLRASRETELASAFPLHVAASWLGNTALVAARHYLTVREDDYAAASRPCTRPTADHPGPAGTGAPESAPPDGESPVCRGKDGERMAWEGPELPHVSTANLTVFNPGGAPGGAVRKGRAA